MLTRRAPAGWLLVGLIILISAVILALVGVTFYLTEHLRITSLRQNQTKAIYLAQAGVMREFYNFRSGNGVSLTETTVTAGPAPGTADDDVYQISGPQADFLLVNMRGNITFPTNNLCGAPRERILGWSLRNVRGAGQGAIRIDWVRVNWSPDGGEGVLRIDLNANTIWAAPCNNPAGINTNIAIPNQTLPARTRWDGSRNRVWFTSSAMDAMDWIDIIFVMSDGSERVSHYDLVSVADSSADFTLRSVGTVRRGAFPFSVWRRLLVDYRLCRAVFGTSCNTDGLERTQEGTLITYRELTVLSP